MHNGLFISVFEVKFFSICKDMHGQKLIKQEEKKLNILILNRNLNLGNVKFRYKIYNSTNLANLSELEKKYHQEFSLGIILDGNFKFT